MIGPRWWTVLGRIMARVEVPEDETGCWSWTGPLSGNGRGRGYPRMCLDGQTVAVHRVMYTLYHGYVPGKKQIDHVCRNRRCVNPAHLEMVTHRENQRRRIAKATWPRPARGVATLARSREHLEGRFSDAFAGDDE